MLKFHKKYFFITKKINLYNLLNFKDLFKNIKNSKIKLIKWQSQPTPRFPPFEFYKKHFWPLWCFSLFTTFTTWLLTITKLEDIISYGNGIYTLFPILTINCFAMVMPNHPFFQCGFLCNFPFLCYVAGIICFTTLAIIYLFTIFTMGQ